MTDETVFDVPRPARKLLEPRAVRQERREFGRRFQLFRSEMGFTNRDRLATATHRNEHFLARIEEGEEVPSFTVDVIKKLAEHFGAGVEFRGAEEGEEIDEGLSLSQLLRLGIIPYYHQL